MSVRSRHEAVSGMVLAYKRADRTEKGRILEHLMTVTGYNRKYLIGLLVHPPPSPGSARLRHRKRRRVYTERVRRVLQELWETLDCVCGKRLVAAIPDLLESLHRHGELEVDPEVAVLLKRTSAATADRLLWDARRNLERHGVSTTKPGSLLRDQIPVRTFADWDDGRPGFLEVDLVAHCGDSTAGEYANSLDLTDVATGWTECVAVANRGQVAVKDAIDAVRRRLPYRMLGIDSDNGSEFINAHLARYCKEHSIAFTRSRPYKKNDQCRVEQKNWTVVRRNAGYWRYEGARAVNLLNELYAHLTRMNNFFLPSTRLIARERNGSRVRKHYDRPQTPYERLLASGILNDEQTERLRRQRDGLNPAQLRRRIIRARRAVVSEAKRYDAEAPGGWRAADGAAMVVGRPAPVTSGARCVDAPDTRWVHPGRRSRTDRVSMPSAQRARTTVVGPGGARGAGYRPPGRGGPGDFGGGATPGEPAMGGRGGRTLVGFDSRRARSLDGGGAWVHSFEVLSGAPHPRHKPKGSARVATASAIRRTDTSADPTDTETDQRCRCRLGSCP